MKLLNYHFKEHNYVVENNKVINKRIVLISDIHYGGDFKKDKISLILDKITDLKPDYIALTGDLIDNTNILEDCIIKKEIKKFLKSLTNITKVIMCIGNHDQFILKKRGFKCEYEFISNKKWFEEIKKIPNLILLDNDCYIEDKIKFIGFTPSFHYYEEESKNNNVLLEELKNKLPALNNAYYNILLIHSPINVLDEKTIKETYIKNVSLILSGHTHNGVMPPILDDLIKGNTGIFSPDGTWLWKAKKTRGKYELEDKTLIINGAITKIHGCSPKWMVLLNELFPMSIDIIDLKGVSK